MVTLISHSSAETEKIGRDWGCSACSGMVIGLSGELGAGKTQLVRGIAEGLGVSGGVRSPTFSLVNIYQGGRHTLFHLDLYRLKDWQEIRAAGLEEYLNPDGVAVIEWAERWFGEFGTGEAAPISNRQGRAFRWAKIEHVAITQRRIIYEDSGA